MYSSSVVRAYVDAPASTEEPHCANARVCDAAERFEDDPLARTLVREFPDGISRQGVSAALGCSTEWVAQLEESGIQKLRFGLAILAAVGAKEGDAILERLRGTRVEDFESELRAVLARANG